MSELRPLPLYGTRLVGRDDALHALTGAEAGPITLVGPGGVGKTRLAVEAARASQRRALFVDASSAFDGADLVRAVLRDLGADAPLGLPPLDEALRRIGDEGIGWVVLDNVEQLGEHVIPGVQRLRERNGLRVVCTSRRAIGAEGERVVTVAPLSAAAGVEVFLRALPRVGPARVDPDRDGATLRALVEALDGNPLAIELAAGRTAVLPLDALVRQVHDAPARALRDPSRPADRGSDVWRSVAWSCDLLPQAARLSLAHAAVFAGPFDLDAARAVLDPTDGAEDVLQLLVAWHLARVSGAGRFVLYQVVRAFAAATYAAELEPAIDRHGAWFLSRVRAVDRARAPVGPLLEHAAEIDTIYERGLAAGAPPERLAVSRELCANAYRLELLRRGPIEHRDLFDRMARAGGRDAHVIPLLAGVGLMSLHLGDLGGARASFEELQVLAREHHDPSQEARALLQLASVERLEGRQEQIAPLVDQALAISRRIGDRYMEMWALGGVGLEVATAQGDYPFVAGRLDEAIAIGRTLPPDQLERMLHLRVGVDLALQDWASARDRLAEMQQIHAQEGQVAWFRVGAVCSMRLLAAIGERGPDAAEEAVAIVDATPDLRPADRAEAWVLSGFALRLAGRGSARLEQGLAALHEEPLPDHRLRRRAVAAAGLALDGREIPVEPDDVLQSPALDAIVAMAKLVQDVVSGRTSVEAAEAVVVAPPSAWTHVIGWALHAAIAQRRAALLAWEIGPAGAWFRSPSGERVALQRSPRLARLVDALAEYEGGLKVDQMFAAGWPGESARPDSQANRVRVAVTTLRQLGLVILGWQRDRGWFLAAPVRRVG